MIDTATNDIIKENQNLPPGSFSEKKKNQKSYEVFFFSLINNQGKKIDLNN